jgi:hypothetical protein
MAVGRRLAWDPMGPARSIDQSPNSPGAPMDRAILHARDAGHAPGTTVRCVPYHLTYTHFRPGRFSHLREDALDAR